jgi:hypothetical protein
MRIPRCLRSSLAGRTVVALAVAVALAPSALRAQDAELVRPDGWEVRFDQPNATEADLEMFVGMPPGWHITTGPAGIFWDPGLTAEGTFRLELDVFLFDPEGRRESFGLFFGGRNLDGADQRYAYFLVRDGGEFILKERQADDAPTIEPWTTHPAIKSYADRAEGEASILNQLAVEAHADRVLFFVNGTEVASIARSRVSTDGVVGLRVNHRLNLHVSRLEVMPLGG